MDKKEAISFLKQSLSEIPELAKLPCDNQEFKLWCHTVETVIKKTLDSDDYDTFESVKPLDYLDYIGIENIEQLIDYPKKLKDYETALKSIIKKYEILGFDTKPANVAGLPPKAFIAHGGESPALNKLTKFLVALGVEPLVVEDQASEDRSVGENVDWYSQQADFAIILAAKGDIDGKTGQFIPRGNVLMEIGKLQLLFKGKIIYLLQSNAKFPSNISEKVWARFSPQSMDNSFTAIARELKAFGILKTVKP